MADTESALREELEKVRDWLFAAYEQCKTCPECDGEKEHEEDCELAAYMNSPKYP